MRRMGLGRRTGVALAATASVAAVLAGVPASASATDAAAAGRGCVVFKNLTERVLSAGYDDVAPEGYSVGDGGSWHNELTNRDGKHVAEAVGKSRVLFQTGDELWTQQDNTDTLADGSTVRAVGVTSVNDLTAGVKQTIPAWGLTGKYEGWTGERSFQLTGEDVYASSLWLCRRG